MVVVDEVHAIYQRRGQFIEMVLSKVVYVNRRRRGRGIQVIGLSATLNQGNLLASWTRAALVQSDFRPIPVTFDCVSKSDLMSVVQRHFDSGEKILFFVSEKN
ncbi:hypothetical protein GEMRC1_004023 [Eukaryota sp. GEM-RC1]